MKKIHVSLVSLQDLNIDITEKNILLVITLAKEKVFRWEPDPWILSISLIIKELL